MPLQATSGAASYDAFGGGVPVVPAYIEEVFSTWLYTGTGPSNQTITNNIDLSNKGGLVWSKNRTGPYGLSHSLIDTVRGNRYQLYSDLDFAQADLGATVTNQAIASFSSTGYVLGGDQSVGSTNSSSSYTYASWTFREQAKFFDIVTYTGNATNRTIAHSLGSVPGSIIVKRTDIAGAWQVYHRSLANTEYLVLNNTDAKATGATRWNSTTPTSAVFSVGTDATVNASGGTYVAYIFAHNAGGFGLTGTDNVISCGSYTGNAGTQSITLGYEPQWIMVKKSSNVGNWHMFDIMRGMPSAYANNQDLLANSADAETGGFRFYPTATGFQLLSEADGEVNASGQTYIYIAIRRGPMKVPTDATKVFSPAIGANVTTSGQAAFTAGFPVDLLIKDQRSSGLNRFVDRLRGGSNSASGAIAPWLRSTSTAAEAASDGSGFDSNTTVPFYDVGDFTGYIGWMMRRAPSFFDEVCYTGTGSATTQTHNLQTVPELIIVKKRNVDSTTNWYVYSAALGNTQVGVLSGTNAFFTSSVYWNNTTPTSSVFSLGTGSNVNQSGTLFVSYLFATAAGVSKVGSYTGNGSTQTIDCGFGAGGARFVLIKRTDSTGDWYVYDTARGMTVLTDPYLLLNSAAAEVATLGSVTTVSTGFALNSTILAAINVSAGTYIFLAIA